MSSWIDRAIAIRTVDAADVPTDGKFRTWKFIGATLTPDGDRLIIEILGGSLLTGAGGTIDVSDTGIAMTSTGLMTVALAAEGLSMGGGPIELDGGDVTLDGGFRFVQAAAPASGAHLTNKTYVDGLVAAGVPDPLTIGTINVTTSLNLGSVATLVGLISLDGSGNDVQCDAANWIFAGSQGFEAHGPTSGVFLDSTAAGVSIRAGGTAATPAAGEVRLQGAAITLTGSAAFTQTCTTWDLTASGACTADVASWALTTTGAALLNGTPIRLFWAVRAIATTNVTVATVSTVDGQALADGELFAPVAQTDPTENGIYTYVDGAGDNVRVAGFNALAQYHLGTTVIAYAGATNKGARYFLEALSSSLPATWTAVPGAGGATDQISDGTASVTCSDPDVAVACASGEFSVNASTVNVVSGTTEIYAASSDVALILNASGARIVGAATDANSLEVGSAKATFDQSGANLRCVWTDAGNATACTSLYDDAACSHTYVGTLTETVGSASRTVTPSGASRTEAYNGSLALSIDFGFQSTAYTNGHSWFSNNRTHRMADVSGLSEIIARPGTAADAAISTATTTTIATFSPDARPSTYHVVVHLWDASGNCAVWDVEVSALLFGGAAVLSGSPPTGIAPTRSVGTPAGSPTLTIDVSTTTVRVRVTTTDTTAVTAQVPTLEKK